MRYNEKKPERAAECVAQFWRFDAGAIDAAAEHIIPPDGMVSLWASFRPGAPAFTGVTGPSVKAHRTEVHPGQVLIGTRLRPEWSGALFKSGVAPLLDNIMPLRQCAPEIGERFERAAEDALTDNWTTLDALFVELSRSLAEIDLVVRVIATALTETDGGASIASLAAKAGLSPRQARRRFEAAVGMAPKAFARVRRVRRACTDAIRDETNWSRLALEAGFTDQAHLARNFQSVFDLPPTRVRAYIRRIAHGDVFSA